MKLALQNLQLRQGEFHLELNVEITGQVIGIFGSSGAGKTTLLEIVAGLRKADSGHVVFDGETAYRVGYVPQDLALFPHMTVRENISYGYNANTSSLTLDHVAKVLEINSLLNRPAPSLSGGQKQRVAFARALLASPRLLLMDEPLASLDHDLKLRIIPYLQRVRDEFKMPMLYVSHSPEEVAALCDQVLVLRNGKSVRACAPADVFESATTVRLKPSIYDSDDSSK